MSEEMTNPVQLDKTKWDVAKNDATVNVTYGEDNAFFDNAGDLTKKQIEEVFKYAHNYITAVQEQGANVVKESMMKDKKLTNGKVRAPYGTSKRGYVGADIIREHTYPGMNGSDPVTKTVVKPIVVDPMSNKHSKTFVRRISADLTEALIS